MISKTSFDQLPVEIHEDQASLGAAAADRSGQVIRDAIAARGYARVILATGNSQLAFLNALLGDSSINWDKVDVFHLDEYVGLPVEHPASFRGYLHRHFIDRAQPRTFHELDGNADPAAESSRYARLLQEDSIDLSCLGIGENGHLAFNDPPYADFDDPEVVKVVELDEVSRRQQVGEGHFPDLDSVPRQALTVTIPALLDAGHVQVVAPEARKAEAVRAALLGPVTEDCPASILRRTGHARLYLDRDSASLLP